MPCGNSDCAFGPHVWPTEGELIVERCEKTCGFCHSSFSSAWFVRRHVRDIHCTREYPNLTVSAGWSGKPTGNAKPHSEESLTNRRANKIKKRLQARHTTPEPTPTAAPVTPPNQTTQLPLDSAFPPYFDLNEDLNGMFDLEAGSSASLSSGVASNGPAASGMLGLNSNNNVASVTGQYIDPAMLTRPSVYVSTSPWSTPQSVRNDHSVVEPVTPTFHVDGGPDTLVQCLNMALQMARDQTTMTDGELLGGAQKFLQNFAHGRQF